MTTGTGEIIATAKLFGYMSSMTFFAYLNIPAEQAFILGILMLFDTLTGIAKQYTLDPVLITSHNLWIGVMKKLGTIISLLAIALVFRALNIEALVYINSAMALIIMSEAYSIIQNIYAVRTGVVLTEYDVISVLLKQFSNFLKNRIESLTSKENGTPKN